MGRAWMRRWRRRTGAARSPGPVPGYGALVPLEQPPSGAGVGISDVGMPIIGEGYAIQAEIAAAVHKAYGETRPQYADPGSAGPLRPWVSPSPRCGT